MKKAVAGFTMIELVIAVAIVLILVAVAFASYQDYEARKLRAQVSTSLSEMATWITHEHSSTGNYRLIRLPYSQIPYYGTARYQVSLLQADTHASDPKSVFPGASENAFTLQAEPLNDDGCGALLIDQSGRRGVTGPGAHVEDCWGK